MLGVSQTITENVLNLYQLCFKMIGEGFQISQIANFFMLMQQQYFMLSIKGAITQTFSFFNV